MLQLSPLFTSRCVFPVDRELRVFGTSDAEEISALLTTKDGRVLTCGNTDVVDGRFLIRMAPVQEALTGLILTVTDGENPVIADDVATGLVFIAGGQSNMELSLWNSDNGQQIVHEHSDEDLRWYMVPKESILEKALAAEAGCSWQKVLPDTCAEMSGVAWYFATKLRKLLGIPVGVIGCYWGGTSVTCWMDEATLLSTSEGVPYMERYRSEGADKSLVQWQQEWDSFEHGMAVWNEAADKLRAEKPGITWPELETALGRFPWCPPMGPGSPYRPCGLEETMLQRIVPAAATAMLYYQGEEDAPRTANYDILLECMVHHWRDVLKNEDLPFVNMQLPMWINEGETDDFTWPRLRISQAKANRFMRNSGLTCIIDCGEFGNIHPTDKKTPGERMADVWLAMNGDAKAAKRLPPQIVAKRAGCYFVVVRADMPLTVRDGDADLFEVCGEDGNWVPAKAVVEGEKITLTAEACPRPVNARYAWISYAKVHVFGENGAPLCPFVTE